MNTTALIGLGSNLGDREATLNRAIAELGEAPGLAVRAVSSYLETEPAGGPPGQGVFLNAALALDSAIDPFALQRVLQRIEQRAGRVRTVRWGERSLDLDLLLFGDQIIDTAELTIPHPRMAVRRFVLAPLAEVAPEAVDPLTGRSIADLLANLDRRPSYIALDLPKNIARPLFQKLVDSLKAAGLSVEDDPSIMGHFHSSPFAARETTFAMILKRKAQELRSDRWLSDLWSDRWLITDFWLDRLYLDLAESAGPNRLGMARELFLEVRSRAIQPTFVVAPHLDSVGLGSWAEANGSTRPIGSDAPILRPDSSVPENLLTEVLAACEASRP